MQSAAEHRLHRAFPTRRDSDLLREPGGVRELSGGQPVGEPSLPGPERVLLQRIQGGETTAMLAECFTHVMQRLLRSLHRVAQGSHRVPRAGLFPLRRLQLPFHRLEATAHEIHLSFLRIQVNLASLGLEPLRP